MKKWTANRALDYCLYTSIGIIELCLQTPCSISKILLLSEAKKLGRRFHGGTVPSKLSSTSSSSSSIQSQIAQKLPTTDYHEGEPSLLVMGTCTSIQIGRNGALTRKKQSLLFAQI
jgi:hypothetical protein